ncbi:DNA-directed RNA polymerase I subunit rpa49-like isoform X2 [Rhodamnia argentea]|uniref:DNA-directed RNA polymerase I subunit rpa49-like isoform X2 n=1 Tax=Rhodamnia argentea TaxID=178133 RepID=A0A8B8NRN6_9MYRT|nr:DNA-directed RNA polymerase I subunit rpa49-like isoform X2 [Rhodamnia argentea]
MDNTEASPTKPKKRPREKLNATIHVLHDNPDKTPPLVGYFPSGFDPSSRLRGGSAEPGVRVYRHSNRKWPNRLQLVVRPPESNVAFVGSSFSGEPNASQSCTYALGVLDKESQTLKIVPVACNKMFRLEPRVGSDFADEEHPELVRGELSAKEKADKVRELNLLFGTKRSVTQDKKMQSLRQEDDPNSQKDLDRKIKEVAINKEALESTGSHTARNIPPYNSSATTPKDAYPIEKIILKGEWDYIRDILQLLEAGEKVSPDAYPTFVCNRIHKMGETQDEMEKETLGCIFSYINHLIKFKDQHSADGASSAKNHRTPSILRQKFSTMFSTAESKWLPSEKIDLLISYVLVLTLFADDFRTDPTDIAKDLRMSSVTIRQHFEHLGCKFKREKNVLYANLPVPLKFPELRKRRRR